MLFSNVDIMVFWAGTAGVGTGLIDIVILS